MANHCSFLQTSAVQLILRLAYIDLFSCIVVIPFNFTEIYIKFTFTHVGLCKAFEYTRTSAEALSCLTLTYIAVDRYQCDFFLFYLPCPATKLRQGYVFTRVCDSVHRGRGVSVKETPRTETHWTETPLDRDPPLR